jgi:hypothetical protein
MKREKTKAKGILTVRSTKQKEFTQRSLEKVSGRSHISEITDSRISKAASFREEGFVEMAKTSNCVKAAAT